MIEPMRETKRSSQGTVAASPNVMMLRMTLTANSVREYHSLETLGSDSIVM